MKNNNQVLYGGMGITFSLALISEAAVTMGHSSGMALDVDVGMGMMGALSVGPVASAEETGPAPYLLTEEVLEVDVGGMMVGWVEAANGSDHALACSISSTVDGGLGARTTSGASLVNGLSLELLPMMSFVEISADTIGSNSISTGDYGTLNSIGSVTLQNLTIRIGGTAIVTGLNAASPNMIFTDVGGILGLTLVLNEQIDTGDGMSATGITTNALRLDFNAVDFGSSSGIDGELIIGQSHAMMTAIPESAWGALGGLGFFLWRRCRA